MATARDRALVVKVARMYYEQNMSQDQIARALLTSRSNVSRILSVAKKRGIVEIKIVEVAKRETELEDMLVNRFGLLHARVAKVPSGTSDYKAVGQLAASHFLTHLKPRVKIAISWGRSLQAMVNELEEDQRPDITLIPLMGGMTATPSSLSGETLIRSLASKLKAEFQVLHSPTIVQSPDVKLALLQEPSVKSVIDAAKTADVAFVGIGAKDATSSSYILQAAGLNREEFPDFFNRLAGDVAGRFYDFDGKVIDTRLEARTVGIDLADLRKIKRVVGVAAGEDKTLGILAALRGKLISELVTSSSCALRLLGMADDKEVRA
jgi:DNA-binding transcriptional regulator LsrR (DeoR family)